MYCVLLVTIPCEQHKRHKCCKSADPANGLNWVPFPCEQKYSHFKSPKFPRTLST
uniref:Uncharacterized protein n=1 Tax=Arundo donax TaxID=35708 RepID=A0A0A8ZW29_ARUDO